MIGRHSKSAFALDMSHPAIDLRDDMPAAGKRMHALVQRLYPICRSITGPGVEETLAILQERLPIRVHRVPTGTRVFDWTVPHEWIIRDAFVKDRSGRRVIDFRRHNLHVVNYSVGDRRTMTWRELKPHLYTLPEHPDWIPYRTSYYHENWGFCLTHRDWQALNERGDDATYEVVIDAEHVEGNLTYGELFLSGDSADEVLFSCHVCHPSLANDNLAGIAVAAELAAALASRPRRYSYRFLFVPATIGALAWLSANGDAVERIRHGLVLTLLGDPGHCTYKQSRRGDAVIDRVVQHVLTRAVGDYEIRPFSPTGYDERQYCSPGFDLPVGCLMRTPHGEYSEYHTSADNPEFVQPAALGDSLDKLFAIVEVIEHDQVYLNQSPFGEPQLGRRGLYQALGGTADSRELHKAVLWTLNLSDGKHSLLDIAERANLPFATIRKAAELLTEKELLVVASVSRRDAPSEKSNGQSLATSATTVNQSLPPLATFAQPS